MVDPMSESLWQLDGVELSGPLRPRLNDVSLRIDSGATAIIGHSGPDRGGLGYAEPRAFGRLLAAFPELRVVLAHLGGGAWKQALEVAQTHANAYFDCCEILEWTDSPNGPSERELGQLIKDIGPQRVMMGSDFPWYDLDHSIDRVMSLPVLSMEEKEGIVGANAVRILGL